MITVFEAVLIRDASQDKACRNMEVRLILAVIQSYRQRPKQTE